MKYFLLIVLIYSSLLSQRQKGFNDYWYSGKAELSSYKLDQFRYKDHHEGEAVLIFVTEDFLKDTQVKCEFGDKENSEVVLKLNRQRRFYTGVYSYTMMTSLFRPIWGDRSLKLTHSSQDWCGQSFLQLNLDGDRYKSELRSYFQSEGDVDTTVPSGLLEDDLYIMVRLDESRLPLGKQTLIPSAVATRFMHIPLKPYDVIISLKKSVTFKSNTNLNKLSVIYSELPRSVNIYYESNFPNKIVGWEEIINGNKTTAVLKKSIKLDYWSKHNKEDKKYRITEF